MSVDKIRVNDLSEIQDGDIWDVHNFKYRIENPEPSGNTVRCKLVAIGGGDRTWEKWDLKQLNPNHRSPYPSEDNGVILRTPIDIYRTVICTNGCGAFVLEPGEKYRDTCGNCPEVKVA